MRMLFGRKLTMSSVGRWIAPCAIAAAAVAGCSDPAGNEGMGQVQASVSSDVVIAEVFSGGSKNSAYNTDYVVLFNRGNAPVNIGGRVLRYATPDGDFSLSQRRALIPDDTIIPAGGYFLVQLHPRPTGGTALPTPDMIAPIEVAMREKDGKIALTVGDDAFTACGSAGTPCAAGTIFDMVGYGAATVYEGSGPTGELSKQNSAKRNNEGCMDTDDNANDFTVSQASNPKNSASPIHLCQSAPDSGPITIPPGLVISEVYTSGGFGGAFKSTFKNDYAILFNRGTEDIPLKNVVLHYAAPADKFSSGASFEQALPDVTLAPGKSFLVQMLGHSAGGGVALSSPPDAVSSIAMNSATGKLALRLSNVVITDCGDTANPCDSSKFIDLIGWGANASQYEGGSYAPGPGADNDVAITRLGSGCQDTNDNSADFQRRTLVATEPLPYTGSAANSCLSGPDGGIDAEPEGGPGGNTDGLVIAEVYGGGNAGGAIYKNDYVVLFNRGSQDVSLKGLALQYASATKNFNTQPAMRVELPDTIIRPGKYFLVALKGGSTGGALPAPDATGNIDIQATNGKVAISRVSKLLDGCGTTANQCSSDDFIDLVGFGTATQSEGGAAVQGMTSNLSAQRKNGGCVDTNNNAADFDVEVPARTVRSSATDEYLCDVSDAGADVEQDTSPDVEQDTSPDVEQDTSPDVEQDTSPDVEPDVVVDPIPDGLVIAEVYGGGGNKNATYKNDYVVLFNRGDDPIPLKNVVLQYASAKRAFGEENNDMLLPDKTLNPGKYFLVKLSSNADVGENLPAEDHEGGLTLGGREGKVALVLRDKILSGCGTVATQCDTTDIIDLVGYGPTASQAEGRAATAQLSSTTSAQRKEGGCQDTDNNANDFDVAATPAAVRNGASPAHDCSGGAGGSGGTGGAGGSGGTGGAGGSGGDAGAGGSGGDSGAGGSGGDSGAGGSGGDSGAGGGAQGGAAGTGGNAQGGAAGSGRGGSSGRGGAGGNSDAGVEAGDIGDEDLEGGCGCSVPGQSMPKNYGLLGVLGLALGWIVRRRRS